jgi:DNA helicase IV
VGPDAELAAEQDVVDEAYRRLDAMRDDARAMLEGVLDLGRGGTFQSRTERDVIVRTSLARLEQLDIGDQALLFGRIDALVPPPSGAAVSPDGAPTGAETFHIGRLAVHGADNEPLVVDWRAPVAEPFYRATGRDPQGLLLRRHLAVEHRKVTGYEDERFDAGGASEPGAGAGGAPPMTDEVTGEVLVEGDVPIGGPAALLAALGRARSGQMTDIVATIQREQDEIIRAPLGGVLVVQGGPGTGKTAVALHRAAYLLYTHRFPLERQGVLVVGPNPLFLRYIEQVLPSLGETGVTLSTITGLVPEVRAVADEPADVARLKGDVRMAAVLARAVRTRQRPLRRDVSVPFGAYVLRLAASDTRRIVEATRRRPGTHNARRKVVEQAVVDALTDQLRRAQRRQPGPAGSGDGSGGDPAAAGDEPLGAGDAPLGAGDAPLGAGDEAADLRELARALRRAPEVRDALDRMWPRLSPHELLHDLFGAPALVAAAARGVLTPDEQALLVRPRAGSLEAVPWTPGDAALVDEARHLLGPRSGKADDQPPSYGHIVVDEVQDLSPMQLRMLARRSLSGSMTVVGDIAQATAPWAARTWDDVVAHLPSRRPVRRVELTVSYRTPAEVLTVAGRVLAIAAPELRPPRPVRRSGVAPRLVAVEEPPNGRDGSSSALALAAATARTAAEEVAAVGDGRVAVLAPEDRVAAILEQLGAAGVDAVDPRALGRGGLAAPLVVLGAEGANGLEFDAVVVVEPAALAGETARGLRTLYVALTRPTRRLAVVYTGRLPGFLDTGGG